MNKKDIAKELEIARNMSDENIDYSDSPDLGDVDWSRFKILSPSKRCITIRLDDEVVDYFKSLGNGYQSKINLVLKEYVRQIAFK